MSTQLIIGILVNTVFFGLMSFRNQKLGIPVSEFLNNKIFIILNTVLYYTSFLIILFSPENLILKIIVCLLMQFLVNHVLWGIVTGIVAGLLKKRININ